MKPIHLLFFFMMAQVLIPGCEFNDEDMGTERASLIVADIDDSVSESDRTQHLIKYEFDRGRLVSTETIVTSPGGQLRFNCEKSRVYRNRYVITDCGDIVDISTRQFIQKGGSGPAYTRLLGVEGDYVFILAPQTEDYFYFDLARQEYNRLEDPGKWALPGLLSPDGTMSVVSGVRNGGEIWLHDIDGEIKLLGEEFYVEYSPLSSSLYGVPLIWLDNERVLTQKSNGILVIVTVDGSAAPVVNIDLSDVDFAPSGAKGALRASFYRDYNSDIIYSISLLGPEGKFRENRFKIDVEDESYAPYDPEWIPLGHKFEYSKKEDVTVFRYEGYEIGQEQYFTEGYEHTIPGHIALISQESPGTYPTSIRVWSSANGKWTSFDFEYPVWITYSSIIGWVD